LVLAYNLFNLNANLKEVNTSLKYLYEIKNLNNKTNFIIADLEMYSYDELNLNLKKLNEKIKIVQPLFKTDTINILQIEEMNQLKNSLVESLKSDSAIVNNSLRNSFKLFTVFSNMLEKDEYLFIQNEILTKMLITKKNKTLYSIEVSQKLLKIFSNITYKDDHAMELFVSNIKIFEQYIVRHNTIHKDIRVIKLDDKIESVILGLKEKFDILNTTINNYIIIFILLLILLLIYLIYSNMKLNIYSQKIIKQKLQLQSLSDNLETKVTEQTSEIYSQLTTIKEINYEVEQNMNFSSRIQNAILPIDDEFEPFFKDKFIFWKPKDTVGGDIYFFNSLKNKEECIIMLIDCTGHGVYGAFLTMLVKALENQIIELLDNGDQVISTADILNRFNTLLQKVLQSRNIYAGFDGQIIHYNKKTRLLKASSANNDIYYISNDEFLTIKATRRTIGYSKKFNPKKVFEEVELIIEEDTVLYLSTDGYMDQFGENDEFIYGKKRFRNLLLEHHKKEMSEQKKILVNELNFFLGTNNTIDDIAIIGLKF
jgi:serine phosphatase RsbU (regulator of sigma subunit)